MLWVGKREIRVKVMQSEPKGHRERILKIRTGSVLQPFTFRYHKFQAIHITRTKRQGRALANKRSFGRSNAQCDHYMYYYKM